MPTFDENMNLTINKFNVIFNTNFNYYKERKLIMYPRRWHRNPILMLLNRSINFHKQVINKKNIKCIRNADRERAIIDLLLRDLEIISNRDKKLFNYFISEIEKCNNYHNYYGLRLEIQTASELIVKNINFIKNETPDYIVDDGLAEIECVSVHLLKEKNDKALNKILTKIKKKNINRYTNKTALFIDYTHILFNSIINNKEITDEEMKNILEEELPTSNFGSIIAFTYRFDRDNPIYMQTYIRVDNEQIEIILKKTLDIVYPLGISSKEIRSIIPDIG